MVTKCLTRHKAVLAPKLSHLSNLFLPLIFWASGNLVASERFHMARTASSGESRRLRVSLAAGPTYYPLPAVGPPCPPPPHLPHLLLLAFRTFSWKMLAATQGQGRWVGRDLNEVSFLLCQILPQKLKNFLNHLRVGWKEKVHFLSVSHDIYLRSQFRGEFLTNCIYWGVMKIVCRRFKNRQ